MSDPTRQALLVETSAGAVHVVAHLPRGRHTQNTAVLILPPFGLDDICSYRPRRDWADALAGRGYVAIRVSYPSAGDSAGTVDDPDRLQAWTQAVTEIAGWTTRVFSRPRLAVIGIEFGGLLACAAVTAGMHVDDLALWAAPGTGRQFIRRLQAFANLEATADEVDPDPDGRPADGVSAGGYRLSEQTVAALGALDVTAMEGLGRAVGRVMMLGRDQTAPDKRLRMHLIQTGATPVRGAGTGYAAMTAPSFEAVTPHATIEEVNAWLDAGAGHQHAELDLPDLTDRATVVSDSDQTVVRESQLTFEGPHGMLAGVMTEADGAAPGGLCALFLDTGTIRAIGPNRMWVEAARRWATDGVRGVRFDLDGMGDSDGDPEPYRDLSKLYAPWIVDQVTSVMAQLRQRRLADRFLIVGLSAGAYWAFRAALSEPDVAAIAMINPGALVWDPGDSPLSDFRTMRTIAETRTLSLQTLRKALGPRGLALMVWLLKAAIAKLLRQPKEGTMLVGHADEVREATSQLRRISARRLVVLCNDEPVLRELTELDLLGPLAATAGVTIERIDSNDHTVRPLWAQHRLHAALDRMVRAEIAALPQNDVAAR